MMAGEGRQQQQVQYVLLHHGQLIGTASATSGESLQFQLHEAGEEIELGPTTGDGADDDLSTTTTTTPPHPITIVQLPATTSADHAGGDEVELEEEIANDDDDVDADQRSTDVLMENSAVVLQCVEATDDDAYLECIGLDIDPGEEGDDPGGGGGGGDQEEAVTVVESDDLGGQVDLQVQETVISMKNNNNTSRTNNNNTTVRTVLIPTSKRIQQDDADDDVAEPRCTTSSSDGGSVLRTLLQANRRQLLMYQSHNHSSERIPFRGGRTTYSRRSEHQISHRQLNLSALAKDDIFVGDGDVDVRLVVDDEGESRAALAQIEQQAPEVAVSQRIDSQIKALLLGHNYVREGGGGGGLARNSTTATSSSTTSTSSSAAAVRRRTTSAMTASDEPSNANKKYKSRVSDHDDEPLLHPLFTEVLKVIAEFSDLNYSVQYGHRSTFLEVCRKGLYGIPSAGQTPVRVIVSAEGIAQFVSVVGVTDQVDCEIRGPTEPSVAERLRPLLHKLSIKSGHVYCPGIDQEYYSNPAASSILLGACRVSESPSSFDRSKECEVWHSIVRVKQENQASTWLGLNEGVHKCHNCRKLDLYLKTLDKKKKMATSPTSTTTTTTSNTIATATTTAKRSSIVERATAINVETGQEFICVWGTTEEMET